MSGLSPQRSPSSEQRLSLCASSSSVLSAILDEDSRQAGSADDLPENGLWKRLMVRSILPNGLRVDKYTPLDWVATYTIGLWYALEERSALQNRHTSGLSSNVIPWGACLPIRVHDWGKFSEQSVGSWLKILPKGTSHPYLVLLFYQISEPDTNDDIDALNEDTRDAFDEQQPSLMYVIDLYFPIELADIRGANDKRLPNMAFFQTLAPRGGKRLICNSTVSRPSLESWQIMHSGEVIELGPHYVKEDLVELDNEPARLDRFGESYVRALLELMRVDKPDVSVANIRACVSKDYWKLRCTMKPAEFRAADSRTRLLMVFCIVYLSRKTGLEATPNAKRLENALVRLVRSEFQLGWSTETSVLDLLNCHGLDTGRIPSTYTPSGIVEAITMGLSPSSSGGSSSGSSNSAGGSGFTSPVTTPTKSGNNISSTSSDDIIRKHIISAQPTTRETVMRNYQESMKSAQPSFGPDMDDSLPDLCALSAKRDSGCGEGLWVRTEDGAVVHRKGVPSSLVVSRGEAFVLADGYPVRFYYVRSEAMKGNAYAVLAQGLHEKLGAGQGSPQLREYTIELTENRELVVYPSILVSSLAVLRIILGQSLVQAYHSVPFGQLWCTLPAFSVDLPAGDLALLDPQPSIQNAMIGIRATLMTNIVRERDGQNSRYAYSSEALRRSCQQLRNLYVSGHPTDPSSRLLAPSVYWLRPSDEVSNQPIETLPEDTRQHLRALPRVDRFSTDTDEFGNAMVLAYRDMPFVFSEDIRSMIRIECAKCVIDYKGRFEDYLRAVGAQNPQYMVKLVTGIVGVLFSSQPLSKLFSKSTIIASSMEDAEQQHASTFEGGDQYGTNKITATADGDEGGGGSTGRDELERIADDLAEVDRRADQRAREVASIQGISMLDAMALEEGFVTTNEAVSANAAQAADKQFRFRSLFDERKSLDQMLDFFRRYPDRFIQAIWERPPGDPKTTIDREPAPEFPPNPKFPNWKPKKGDWYWIDRHNGVGGLGPFTLMGYTYCFMVGRCGYVKGRTTGESSNHNYHPDGVRMADIQEVDNKRKREKTGPVVFVGELIELVKEASKRLPEPCEGFTAWWRRLVEPLFRKIRAEEEAKAEEDANNGKKPPAEPYVEDDPKRKKNKSGSDKPAAPNSVKDAEKIQRYWDTALRIDGRPATYLRICRNLDVLDKAILEDSPFLRYVHHMTYELLKEDGKTKETIYNIPCIIAFCIGKTGCTSALHRIYLGHRSGDNYLSKAVFPQYDHDKNKIKLSMGSLRFDAHYFLAQPGRIEHWPFIYLSEGPEKSLAVAACSRYAMSFATMGVSRFDGFAHLKDMEPQPAIIIAGDADHTMPIQKGKVESLRRSGWKNVLYWVPQCIKSKQCHCKDANDVLDNHGLHELRKQLGFPAWTWVNSFPKECTSLYEPPEKEWRRYEFLRKYTDH